MIKSIVIRNLKEDDNGNAFALRKKFFCKTNAKTLVKAGHECKSGDYDHLVITLLDHSE